MSKDYLFKAEKICKSFGYTRALHEVDLMISRGEIRGLIGENGSGKSTLATIIAGIQYADKGALFLNGQKYKPQGVIDAINKGVAMVVQEQGTIGKISVAANIFLGKESQFVKYGILNIEKMNREAKRAMTEIEVNDIKPNVVIDKLSFEERKLVELARSLYTIPQLWIIDETTTALTINGREILYKLMERVKSQGSSVIFISHDMEEILNVCDSLTILRDGVVTANLEKKDFCESEIKQLMIGRQISDHYYRQDINLIKEEKIVLEMRKVSKGELQDINFSLHKGEILGIGGLSDCGMHVVGKILFGLVNPDQGQVLKAGKQKVKNAVWAVKEGMAYISKDRDKESLMVICSIKDNICAVSWNDLSRNGIISKKKENIFAQIWLKNMEIKANGIEQFCNTLSGGNKQKVVLAKWLAKGSDILILDCPTRGIDIGTKAAIYQLMDKMRQTGKSIVLISEELSELIGMSDRVIILKNGKISGEFAREDGLTEAKLIQKMI